MISDAIYNIIHDDAAVEAEVSGSAVTTPGQARPLDIRTRGQYETLTMTHISKDLGAIWVRDPGIGNGTDRLRGAVNPVNRPR